MILEKKAGNRKYRVRGNPVTHFLSPSYAEKGLRRALCCVVVGRHRHDDGFTRSLGNVTCERCRSRLPYWDTADVTNRINDPDRSLRDLKISKPDPAVGNLDSYQFPIIKALYPDLSPLDDLLKIWSNYRLHEIVKRYLDKELAVKTRKPKRKTKKKSKKSAKRTTK